MSYNPEWKDCYQYLEDLRYSGEVNMYGARPYLREFICYTIAENPPNAATVLASWMRNYDALVEDGVITRWE